VNKLAEHLFVSSCDGALHDTRMLDWSKHPIRPDYARTFARINNSLQLRATIRAGAYAWPGGYQMYLIANDGEALCFDCAQTQYYQCAYSIRHGINDGWRIVGCDINYEDPDLYCAHCSKSIPSAYGNDEKENAE
jgi:hypothetical protein